MTKPMAIQTISSRQVVGRQPIHQVAAKNHASGATSQKAGVRNGRGISGSVKRKTNTPAQTMAKREQRADGHELAQQADGKQTCDQHGNRAVRIWAIQGVRNFG